MLKNRRNKLICSIMLLSVIASTSLTGNALALNESQSNNAIDGNANLKQALNISYQNGGPADPAIANEEKTIEMLKHEGKIAENATYEEAHKGFIEYMRQFTYEENKPLSSFEKKLQAAEMKNPHKTNVTSNSDNVTEVNVLAVLTEFSDYKHNSIPSNESERYYENFDKQHYYDMLFGDNGYKGPDGKNYISLKQYYAQQSGGTLKVNGDVTDWYTAPGTLKYYGEQVGSAHDARARKLATDALDELGKDGSIDLSKFDKIDRYDMDGDGNYDEPDGLIDYLIIIHAGVGQEAGGDSSIGTDAIWSHRTKIGNYYPIQGTSYTDEDGNTRPYYALDYTMDPEDGCAGVFCHEFGHDLGLPDEYDTKYSSDSGEPVAFWSLMSSASWAGTIPETEPPCISPYGRQILQNKFGGNWQKQTVVNYGDLTRRGISIPIKAASKNGEVIRVNLPDKTTDALKPFSGSYCYWGGTKRLSSGKESMTTSVDLTNAANPELTFKTWYSLENGWDFASVQAKAEGDSKWTYLESDLATPWHDPDSIISVPYGITGKSDGWVDGIFDLSAYAGKKIDLKFEYETDPAGFEDGFFIDEIKVSDGNNVILSDDGESESKMALNGFIKHDGLNHFKNYYLIEWRDHSGVDIGLKHVHSFDTDVSYDPGMVVWYVNDFYTDNLGANHPGYGYLSVVDADQNNIKWTFEDKSQIMTSNRYQMHDAAFSCQLGSKFFIDASKEFGRTATDKYRRIHRSFKDTDDYSNQELPTIGTILPKLGINIDIFGQKLNNSGATIRISHK